MADTEPTFTVDGPHVRQVKDSSFERGPAGAYDVATELPGHLELYYNVNGAPWVVARRKAPGLLADIQRAKDEAEAAASRPAESSY